MRGRTLALLVTGACGVTACGRTELEGFNATDASAPDARFIDASRDARAADAPGDTSAPEASHDGPCHWTFAPQATYGADGNPIGVAVADFTGDGVPDILAVNGGDGSKEGSDNVNLLINDGDGTFARRASFSAGAEPFAMATGDFSGDGKLDLAIIYEFQASGVSHELSVFLNRGDGTFAPPASYPINGGAFAVTTGDFNGDGWLDLAVIDALTKLSVLDNRGDGTFGPPSTFTSGVYVDQLTTADFNHDGVLDIATGGTFSENVLINQGGGAFTTLVTYPYSAACNYLGRIVASDLTGDGYPELIRSCSQFGSLVAVRINNGDGTLGSEVTYETGNWPSGVVVADFTGDGRVDLAVANSFAYAKSVSVLPNEAGTLGPQVTYPVTTPNEIAAGDLDGDGHADLVTAGGSTVSVLLSRCE